MEETREGISDNCNRLYIHEILFEILLLLMRFSLQTKENNNLRNHDLNSSTSDKRGITERERKILKSYQDV